MTFFGSLLFQLFIKTVPNPSACAGMGEKMAVAARAKAAMTDAGFFSMLAIMKAPYASAQNEIVDEILFSSPYGIGFYIKVDFKRKK